METPTGSSNPIDSADQPDLFEQTSAVAVAMQGITSFSFPTGGMKLA